MGNLGNCGLTICARLDACVTPQRTTHVVDENLRVGLAIRLRHIGWTEPLRPHRFMLAFPPRRKDLGLRIGGARDGAVGFHRHFGQHRHRGRLHVGIEGQRRLILLDRGIEIEPVRFERIFGCERGHFHPGRFRLVPQAVELFILGRRPHRVGRRTSRVTSKQEKVQAIRPGFSVARWAAAVRRASNRTP